MGAGKGLWQVTARCVNRGGSANATRPAVAVSDFDMFALLTRREGCMYAPTCQVCQSLTVAAATS